MYPLTETQSSGFLEDPDSIFEPPKAGSEPEMIRVAAYCRVSTDKEDQANSFSAQQSFFRGYIGRNPHWQLYRIYADEGISGTGTRKRAAFNQMISDACRGCFQLIITKEVSRFSRNILDTIYFTRELSAMGVFVYFLTDGICTMQSDSEMRLSIMASLAQEESRRTSARVVWGQTRQMEKGVVFGGPLLGYDVKNGSLSVETVGAETVREIFHLYAIERLSAAAVAKKLTEQGSLTLRGNRNWNAGTVLRILRNEKYAGDLIQKKTYTPNYLTHEKRRNIGQVPQIRLRDHHEAIVSRELWELAQERLNRAAADQSRSHMGRAAFSGKIICGECGAAYVCRYQYRKDGTKIRRWVCGNNARNGVRGCSVGRLLRDDDAIQMAQTAIRQLTMDRERFYRSLLLRNTDGIRKEIEALLDGAEVSEPFLRNTVDRITVFSDRHLELRLLHLPLVFRFLR